MSDRALWQYRDRFYWDEEGLDSEDLAALLLADEIRRSLEIEAATSLVAMTFDQIQDHVMDRDGGRCLECGSLDGAMPRPIVPLESGGQLSPSNLRVLCRACRLPLA